MGKTVHLENLSWGTEVFDNLSGGVPAHLMSVVETPDHHSGNIVLGQFIYDGLKKGERCVLITFESPLSFLENFYHWDLNFKDYLSSEQFIFLNYQPNIAYEAGLTHDYDSILTEVRQMCGGQMPQRLVIHQVDTLVNLNNPLLINVSAQKLAAAALSYGTDRPTILGQFVKFDDETHKNLAVAFQKTAHGYFAITQPDPLLPHKYSFQAKKIPWFNFVKQPTAVNLVEGEGFKSDGSQRSPQRNQVA